MKRAHTALAVALIACGGSARPATDHAAQVPIWERPGLEGHLRPEVGPPQPGDPAPDFELPRTDGTGTFRLSSAHGSWVFLHFTASWCPFCDEEVEHLGRIAVAYQDHGVRVALIDIKETPERWRQYLSGFQLPPALIVLEDADGEAARRWAPPRLMPSFQDRSQVVLASSILVDPEGKVRLFVVPDSTRFDPTLAAIRRELNRMMGVDVPIEGSSTAPRAATEPAALPPDQVVEIEVDPVSALARGASTEVSVRLRIADGYHVMSNQPSQPEYIATEVRLTAADGLTVEPARFPPSLPFRLVDEDIATFAGAIVVKVPVRAQTGATPGPRRLTGTVRYQACTRGNCLFPIDRPIELEVDLIAP